MSNYGKNSSSQHHDGNIELSLDNPIPGNRFIHLESHFRTAQRVEYQYVFFSGRIGAIVAGSSLEHFEFIGNVLIAVKGGSDFTAYGQQLDHIAKIDHKYPQKYEKKLIFIY
ncbi:hypothetical protein BpHYR1_002175 [Brachionus plicatilis]|uniref:Uncharacterized protein n=1 Tax=Brachionus plicatilis TaxID=10195 RepID=A0A3M7QAI4_BRAPC|nr:hypothetical protein BpHYR1_002175 [Brachionus plicatilis]